MYLVVGGEAVIVAWKLVCIFFFFCRQGCFDFMFVFLGMEWTGDVSLPLSCVVLGAAASSAAAGAGAGADVAEPFFHVALGVLCRFAIP